MVAGLPAKSLYVVIVFTLISEASVTVRQATAVTASECLDKPAARQSASWSQQFRKQPFATCIEQGCCCLGSYCRCPAAEQEHRKHASDFPQASSVGASTSAGAGADTCAFTADVQTIRAGADSTSASGTQTSAGAAETPSTGAAGAGVGSQLAAGTSSGVHPGVDTADIEAGAGVGAGVGAQALMDSAGLVITEVYQAQAAFTTSSATSAAPGSQARTNHDKIDKEIRDSTIPGHQRLMDKIKLQTTAPLLGATATRDYAPISYGYPDSAKSDRGPDGAAGDCVVYGSSPLSMPSGVVGPLHTDGQSTMSRRPKGFGYSITHAMAKAAVMAQNGKTKSYVNHITVMCSKIHEERATVCK